MSTKANETVIISGTAMWAKVQEPDTNGKFTVDVVVSDKEATRLEKLGLEAAKLRDGTTLKSYEEAAGKVFRAKTNAVNSTTGEANRPPLVVDSSNKRFTGLIGNGSKVNVKVGVGHYNFQGRKGVNAYLNAIQIVELVEFKSNPIFDVVDGGFTASGDATVEDDSTDTEEGPF